MRDRVSSHIRSNLVGYLALFVALSGTAWAANGPLAGRNSVGSADIIKNEVKSSDIGPNAVKAADIADASSGSDAVDADTLDGLDSDAFAAAGDLSGAQRVKTDDPTPGDLDHSTVPLFTNGSVSIQGECTDDFSLGNEDRAEVRVLVTGTGNGSFSAISSDEPPFVSNIASFSGGTILAGTSQSNASSASKVRSSYFTVVAPNGEVVSGAVSSEINDNDGGGHSDCAFAATGTG